MMNREIKFRAWVKRYDEPFMLYLKPNMTWRDVENGLVLSFTEDGGDYGYAEVSAENLDYPVMQFTGLLDKNGKEIYENDVIEVLLPEREPKNIQRMTIEWESGGFIMANNAYAISLGDTEEYKAINIVGNIFENPNLHYSSKGDIM